MYTPDSHPLNFDTDDVDIFVEMDEAKSGHGNVTIATDGLGPCIAVILHNARLQTGYVAHCVPEDIPDAVQETPKSYIADDTNAWLVGGGYVTGILPIPREHTLAGRETALNALTQIGIKRSNITLAWIDDANYGAAVCLNIASGTCQIGVQEDLGRHDHDAYDIL